MVIVQKSLYTMVVIQTSQVNKAGPGRKDEAPAEVEAVEEAKEYVQFT
jgi:hypothetical protein